MELESGAAGVEVVESKPELQDDKKIDENADSTTVQPIKVALFV